MVRRPHPIVLVCVYMSSSSLRVQVQRHTCLHIASASVDRRTGVKPAVKNVHHIDHVHCGAFREGALDAWIVCMRGERAKQNLCTFLSVYLQWFRLIMSFFFVCVSLSSLCRGTPGRAGFKHKVWIPQGTFNSASSNVSLNQFKSNQAVKLLVRHKPSGTNNTNPIWGTVPSSPINLKQEHWIIKDEATHNVRHTVPTAQVGSKDYYKDTYAWICTGKIFPYS